MDCVRVDSIVQKQRFEISFKAVEGGVASELFWECISYPASISSEGTCQAGFLFQFRGFEKKCAGTSQCTESLVAKYEGFFV